MDQRQRIEDMVIVRKVSMAVARAYRAADRAMRSDPRIDVEVCPHIDDFLSGSPYDWVGGEPQTMFLVYVDGCPEPIDVVCSGHYPVAYACGMIRAAVEKWRGIESVNDN